MSRVTIHPLRLRYSNAYLLVGERPILVDTGSRGDAPRIEAALAAVGVTLRDLSLVLHTHVHSDHFGNTAEFAAKAGCPVSYHPADQMLAVQGNNGSLQGIGLRGRVLARLCAHLPFHSRSYGGVDHGASRFG
jgi:glyoxylase-like metal-dependent hydrolase (beta-lactamase superfamily II)